MIIDAHTHVFDGPWLPNWFWTMINQVMAGAFGVSVEQMTESRRKSWDPTGNIMVKSLDHAGIDKAVVCVVDIGLADPREDTALPIEEINHQTYEMCRRHPGRLYFCAGVDPRRKNAVKIVERAVKEWGAVSLKLQPAAGWYPNDQVAYPLYKKCAELGLPVDFHTGPQPAPFKSQCAHPMYLEDVAFDFPKLTIQCTHAGDVLFMDALALAKGHPNVILDLASWGRWLFGSRTTAIEFYKTLRFMMDMIGPRLLFASDWDGRLEDEEICGWVAAFRNIPPWVKEAGIEFSAKEIEGFMGGNALKYLNLGK